MKFKEYLDTHGQKEDAPELPVEPPKASEPSAPPEPWRSGRAKGEKFVDRTMAVCLECAWRRDDTQVAREGMRTLAREHAARYGHVVELSARRGIRYFGRGMPHPKSS